MARDPEDTAQASDAEVGERLPLLAPPPLSDGVTDGAGAATTTTAVFRAISRRFYASHFLSTWNSRVFEFGNVLYLASLFPGTLLPLSVYALARGIAAILFAPAVGHFVNRAGRLRVVRLFIAVATSCAIFYIFGSTEIGLGTSARNGLLALLCFFAYVEKLSAIINFIAVKRDWVPVVAGALINAKLALNSQIRRIDIFCKFAGPIFIAFIDGAFTKIAIVANFAINLALIPAEYVNISKVYYEVPDFQRFKVIFSLPAEADNGTAPP
ncbi:hypothetical protein RB598_001785 [Gaeumannomyces tritici]